MGSKMLTASPWAVTLLCNASIKCWQRLNVYTRDYCAKLYSVKEQCITIGAYRGKLRKMSCCILFICLYKRRAFIIEKSEPANQQYSIHYDKMIKLTTDLPDNRPTSLFISNMLHQRYMLQLKKTTVALASQQNGSLLVLQRHRLHPALPQPLPPTPTGKLSA